MCGADEHRPGVAHAGGDGGGVRGLDLQVLGGVGVDDGEPGLDVVDEDDRGLGAAQRLLDAAGVLGGRDPVAEDRVDGVGELRRVGDQDGGGHRVVLGLADEVGGDVHRVGVASARDGDLGRAGLGVDADGALDVPLGRGDVDVARAGDDVDRFDDEPCRRRRGRRRANIAMAWAPPTAYTSSTPSSAQAARIVGWPEPPNSLCAGVVTAIEPTPATGPARRS